MVPKLNDRHTYLAIFGPFLDLQEFFKNQGVTFQTSDFDFRGLLDELFHMRKKIFRKKIKMTDNRVLEEFMTNKNIWAARKVQIRLEYS